MATTARPLTAGQEWATSWKIVLGAAIGMGTGFSLFQFVSSIFFKGLAMEFGWSRGQISAAFAMALIGAFAAPLVGRLIDKIGIRPVVTASVIGLSLCYIGLANMTGSLPLFYALNLGIALCGVGCAGVAYTRAVNSWFKVSRGLALGATLTGVSFFAAITPIILGLVIADHGWRAGYYTMAVIAAVVGLPLVLSLVWERREWDRKQGTLVGAFSGPEADETHADGLVWKEILRTRPFWLLILCMIAINIPGAGILSQMVPLMTDRGLSPPTAAAMISYFAAAVFVGHLATGYLIDRLHAPRVAFFYMLLPALGSALLLWGAQPSVTVAIAAVVLLGLAQGAEIDLLGYFCARYFGMRTYSSVFGSMITAMAVSSAAGVALFGRVFDQTGSYDNALLLAVVLFPIGAFCFAALGPYPKGILSADPHAAPAE
jgi:MFS family permease